MRCAWLLLLMACESRPQPPLADCTLVAQALASHELGDLGDYAPLEDRAPVEARLKVLCEREKITAAEQACLVEAPTTTELAWCRRPLIVDHVEPPSRPRPHAAPPRPPIGPTLPRLTPVIARPMPAKTGDICEDYVRLMERIASCRKVPPDTQQQVRDQIPRLRQMYQQYGTVQSARDSCVMAYDALVRAIAQMGC